MSELKKHCITNVVYGQPYLDIFCNLHLKSFLDPTNIPAVRDRMHYEIFVDTETAPLLKEHSNFKKLADTCSTHLQLFDWHDPKVNRFSQRYSLLVEFFHTSVAMALKNNAYLSSIVADLVCAKDFLPKLHDKMDAGHGAVFMLPLRATYDSMRQGFEGFEGALEPKDLCAFGQANLHPLWWACHWKSPLFTRLPFSLIWSTPTGVLARSFSVTPIIFNPTIHMLNAKQVIDVEVPAHCENVYWCENWTDAPLIGVEPLPCYYPPFGVKTSDEDEVGQWAQNTLHPSQFNYLDKNFYYPDKETVNLSFRQQEESDDVVRKVGSYGGFIS